MKKTKAGSCGPPPFKHYYMLLINTINNIANFDMENIQRKCINRFLNSGIKKNIPRCYEIVSSYTHR